jgi:hypothetical protein
MSWRIVSGLIVLFAKQGACLASFNAVFTLPVLGYAAISSQNLQTEERLWISSF